MLMKVTKKDKTAIGIWSKLPKIKTERLLFLKGFFAPPAENFAVLASLERQVMGFFTASGQRSNSHRRHFVPSRLGKTMSS
jgi:hypothetical protein